MNIDNPENSENMFAKIPYKNKGSINHVITFDTFSIIHQ